jgi:hypothetical protein
MCIPYTPNYIGCPLKAMASFRNPFKCLIFTLFLSLSLSLSHWEHKTWGNKRCSIIDRPDHTELLMPWSRERGGGITDGSKLLYCIYRDAGMYKSTDTNLRG